MSASILVSNEPKAKYIPSYDCECYSFLVRQLTEANGAKFQVQFCFDSLPNIGDTWTVGGVTFTFQAITSSVNPYQIQLTGQTIAQVRTAVSLILAETLQFADYNIISTGLGNCFTILSLKQGSDFNIQWDTGKDSNDDVAGFISSSQLTQGADPTFKANHKIIGRLEKKIQGEWIFQDSYIKSVIPVSINADCSLFEATVAMCLRGCLKFNGRAELPDPCCVDAILHENYACEYRFRVAPAWGSPLLPRPICYEKEFYTIPIKESSINRPVEKYWRGDCTDDGLVLNLNNHPDEITVCKDTPVWLTLFADAESFWTMQLNIDVEYEGGITESFTNADQQTGNIPSAVTFPIGANALALSPTLDCIMWSEEWDCCDNCWTLPEEGIQISGGEICINPNQQNFHPEGIMDLINKTINLMAGGIYEINFEVNSFQNLGGQGLDVWLTPDGNTFGLDAILAGSINGDGSFSFPIDLSSKSFNYGYLTLRQTVGYVGSNPVQIASMCIPSINIRRTDARCGAAIKCYTITAQMTEPQETRTINFKPVKVCIDDCCTKDVFYFLNDQNAWSMICFEKSSTAQINVAFDTIEICDCEDGGIRNTGGTMERSETVTAIINKDQADNFDAFLRSIEKYKLIDGKLISIYNLGGQFQTRILNQERRTVIQMTYNINTDQEILVR